MLVFVLCKAHCIAVLRKHCKNELVARMDSDDIAYSDRCEKQIAVFNTHSEVSICSGIVEEFTTDPNTVDTRRVLPETNAEIVEFAKKRNPFNHPCVMYKKSAVEAVGSYQDFYLLEDYYLWLRILYSCHPRSRHRLEKSGFKLDPRVRVNEPLGFNDYNKLQMNALAIVSDSGTLPEESSFYLSIGHPIAAVCIRTSTERPEALEAGDFILAGITTRELLNATDMAIKMKQKGVLGKPCPDYVDETVSMKVVRIIQGYVNVVNKMVWRKY